MNALPLARVRLLFRYVTSPSLFMPLVLLGAVVMAYGLWIPRLGLFGDDWPYIWYYHLLGPGGPGDFAAMDRPLSGWFYAVSVVLLGKTALPYHLFLLALRWGSSVLFWRVLVRVWPERGAEAALAAVLMAVYPGFRQNPIAVEFILHLAVFDLFLASLELSLVSLNSSQRRYWLLAVLSAAGAAGMFALEYFVGLEVLRPILLWIVASRAGLRGAARWLAIVKAWLPAALSTAAFLAWRVFVFQFPTYGPGLLSEMASDPAQGLLTLAERIARGFYVGLVGAWRSVLVWPEGALVRLAYLVLLGVAFVLFLLFFWRQMRPGGSESAWGETAVAVGLLAMLGGGAPFWVTGIPITIEFPWDRPTLSLMPGASLVVAGLLAMVVTSRYRPVLAAALVSLAIGAHFQNGDVYFAEWKKLQSFTWQLAWRVPALKPGTLVLFDVIPLNRYSDNDLSALLNWTYAPDLRTRELPYRYFDLTLRLDEEHNGLPGLEKGLPVAHDHRGTIFRGSTSQMLVLDFQPPSCLKVFDASETNWPGLTDRLQLVLPLADISLVEEGSAVPPPVLGAEPARDWCYFFQKSELAVQRQDWQAVVRLFEQSQAGGFRPNSRVEWAPFIEGHARAGLWEQSQALAKEASEDSDAHPVLCSVWRRLQEQAARDNAAPGVFQEIGCLAYE